MKLRILLTVLLLISGVIAVGAFSYGVVSRNPDREPEELQGGPISWIPGELNVVLPAGRLSVAEVSFKANEEIIGPVEVYVVPALMRFVAPQRISFSYLPSGSVSAIQLAFLVPDDTALGTYDGTLHLRVGQRTLPQTLKITLGVTNSLSDGWLGVSVSDFNYRIKYPPQWESRLLANGNLQLRLISTGSAEPDAVVNVYVVSNKDGADLPGFLHEATQLGEFTEGGTEFGYPVPNLGGVLFVPVNGVRSVKLLSTDGFSSSQIYVPAFGSFIVLELVPLKDSLTISEIIDTIASSLRF